MFLRGFVSKRWAIALSWSGSPSPVHVMTKILRLIWTELFEPLWTTRNDILHQSRNHIEKQEHTRLSKLLQWFYLNRREFLINFEFDDIDQMTPSTRKQICRNLETTQEAYQLERANRPHGQPLIMSFFHPLGRS